ncbi:hypothetical protein ACFCW2_08255 [Qipengyuania sp. DSG2-2]|uniref:RICIN domain-containing protein n=1 Tax=Qipengyuania sp. DGS2-2 TaxID=3349631 RepID=UPI0036D2DFA9
MAAALASAMGLGAAPIMEAPAFAQNEVQRMNQLARPHGAAGGTYVVQAVPPDADIIGLRVYADENSQNRRIFGIKLRYQNPFDGSSAWTPTMGSAEGKAFDFAPRAGERVNRLTVWTRRNGALAGIHLGTNLNAYGVFSRTYDGKRTIDVGRDREFGGLTARTDGRFVLALGMIAFDPADPWANRAWASSPPFEYRGRGPGRGGADPRAPWESEPRQVGGTGPRGGSNDAGEGFPRQAQNTPPRSPAAKPPVSKPAPGKPVADSTPPSKPVHSLEYGQSVDTKELTRISNRWKPDQRVDVAVTDERNKVISNAAPDGYWGAQWAVEGDSFASFRLRNRWTGKYLINKEGRGPLVLGDSEPSSKRDLWALEQVSGDYFHITSLYSGAKLHIQDGALEAGPVQDNWWSAQWLFKNLEGVTLPGTQLGIKRSGAPATAPATPPATAPTTPADLKLVISQQGAFLAHMKVTFKEPGKLWGVALNERNVPINQKRTLTIPYAARDNIKVQTTAVGLTRTFDLINKTITLDDGACILLTGSIVTREGKQTSLDQC